MQQSKHPSQGSSKPRQTARDGLGWFCLPHCMGAIDPLIKGQPHHCAYPHYGLQHCTGYWLDNSIPGFLSSGHVYISAHALWQGKHPSIPCSSHMQAGEKYLGQDLWR